MIRRPVPEGAGRTLAEYTRRRRPRLWSTPMTYLEPGKATWETVWRRLAEALEDMNWGTTRDACPVTGEAWQYMGTTLDSMGRDVHTFRHRHHPAVNSRVYAKLGFDDEITFTIMWKKKEEIVNG